MADQKSEAWLLERLGHITGSRFGEVIAMDKTGKRFLKSRETAITEITLELLTGRPGAMWTSKATDWGNAHEGAARMAYEAKTGHFCQEVGFITHPVYEQIGCSPDGLITGLSRGYESKCPYNPTVHLDTLLNGMPEEHMAQVQGGMFVCDCDTWDFVSYSPVFPEPMRLYVQTIERDQAYIHRMTDHLLSAVEEINSNVRRLLERYGVEQ